MRSLHILLITLLLSACAQNASIDYSGNQPFDVDSPVRVHMVDGTTVEFEDGFSIADDMVTGDGILYDQNGDEVGILSGFSLGDVAAMESYQSTLDTAASVATVIVGSVLLVVVVGALALALFGSCPTVYSVAADIPILEAELFSYNIAPVFQSRDVDYLGVAPTADGRISLEIRNEMLETHYIDQLELLEVIHEPGQKAYPGRNGRPIIASNLVAPSSARDQDGGNVLPEIRSTDDQAWSATDERLANTTEDDYIDHLYLEFDVPDDVNDPAVVLRLRNSMLNTELFYGVMLEDQGFGALDWLGKDLNRFSNAVRTGRWYRDTMGLGIEVWDNGRYEEIGRIPDQGPIAWSERALKLPDVEPQDGKLKVRLSFVTDNWRFDQVSLALDSETGKTRVVPVHEAETKTGTREDIPAFLANSDKEYLVTRPTDSVRVHFETGLEESGKERTFFLASDGYYIEWMRADWLTNDQRKRFNPGSESLLRAINQYAQKRDDYRQKFESSKIEVR